MNLESSFPPFAKKKREGHWKFDRDYANLCSVLGSIVILTMLNLLIHEHGKYFHLSRSSLIYLSIFCSFQYLTHFYIFFFNCMNSFVFPVIVFCSFMPITYVICFSFSWITTIFIPSFSSYISKKCVFFYMIRKKIIMIFVLCISPKLKKIQRKIEGEIVHIVSVQ